jgi:predicted alpha-1,2-mannosidase
MTLFPQRKAILAVLLMIAGSSLFAQRYSSFIDPFIGSEGDGNVFVGPSCPFGMVKPGPDCSKASNSGYRSDTTETIYGFSQLHVSGTGGGPKYGNISIMPFSGNLESINQESLRGNETAKVGYYSVLLKKWDISTEITTTPKVAFYRFVFNKKDKAVKIDLGQFLGEKPIPDSREAQQFVGSEIKVISDTEVEGYSRIRGGWNNGNAYTVYFHAVFDKPFSRYTTWKGEKLYSNKADQFDSGDKTGAFVYFNTILSDTVQVKIGISFISSLKARQNVATEIPDWDFKEVLQETQDRWENLVKKIEIADATTEQKRMFYTALYHTMLMPVDRTGENPLWRSTQPYYDDFYAIWDTYRCSHPLMTLITPSRQIDIVNALLDIYKHDGYMPDARSGNCNGRTQGGSNAEVLIADAYVKGLKGIDYGLGLQAMLKDATIPPGGNEEKEGRGGLTDYNTLGYISNRFVRAGNRTLEYSYDDYCIAEVAKGLNRLGEYRRFLKQSTNWQNLWRDDIEDHGAKGFIMPKDPSGHWIDSIPCDMNNGRLNYLLYSPMAQDWPDCVCWWCGFFYEAGSWEYSLFVPHDVPTLIRKSDGNEAFLSRLNTLFDNGYYDVGNEPSFLSSCLYHWIGRPDLSNWRTRKIINKNYNDSRAGLPGNDDSGAMSSWLAFHMIGLYPNAGQSYYLITAPFFRQTVIHLESGKDFKLTTRNLSDKNCYVKSVFLNGKPFYQAWIEHADIVQGGELIFEMDSKPSATWGTTILPPSDKP